MSNNTYTTEHGSETSFEMFRLSKSKEIVDVCPNTLRSYFKQGLPFYKRGKAVFVSKAELAAFIRRGDALPDQGRTNCRHKRITEQELKRFLGIPTTEGGAA